MNSFVKISALLAILGSLALGVIVMRGQYHRHAASLDHTHTPQKSSARPHTHSHGRSHRHSHSHSHTGSHSSHSHHTHSHPSPHVHTDSSQNTAVQNSATHADGAHWHVVILGVEFTLWDTSSFFFRIPSMPESLPVLPVPLVRQFPPPLSGNYWTIPLPSPVEDSDGWSCLESHQAVLKEMDVLSGQILPWQSSLRVKSGERPPVPPPRSPVV